MLNHYLIVSFRNLRRHKVVTLINIFGLSMGMSVCLLVLMLIKNQLSYDNFHPYPERTFRILTSVSNEMDASVFATSPLPLARELAADYPFVERSVQVHPAPALSNVKTNNGRKEIQLRGAFVSESFFSVFGFPLESGNPNQALAQPNSIVMTREAATRLFNDNDPVGKTVSLQDLGNFVITGVLAEANLQTHLDYEILVSMASLPILEKTGKIEAILNEWSKYEGSYTYVLLKESTDLKKLSGALPAIANNAMKTFDFKVNGLKYAFQTQPLGDITVSRGYFNEPNIGMSFESLAGMSTIALIILLIGTFNYTNLAIARFVNRAKEVGVRKVAGANRRHIIIQFLFESVLLTLISLVSAYFIAKAIPLNEHVTQIVSRIKLDFTLIALLVSFSLLVGILAGLPPALWLSRITSAQALNSMAGTRLLQGINVRKTFIVVQFVFSLVAIINLLVMYQQTQFAATGEYGYNRKGVISIDLMAGRYQALRDEVAKHSEVTQVSAMSGNFGFDMGGRCNMQRQKGDNQVGMYYFAVDQGVVPMMGLTMMAGTNFGDNLSSTAEQYVLLNEESLKVLNLGTPAAAVGRSLWMNDSTLVQVAGVVKNFHFHRFKFPMAPLVLRYIPNEFRCLNVRLKSADSNAFIAYLDKVWKQFDKSTPLSWYDFEKRFYEHQSHMKDIMLFGTFALLCLLISCLGLLGVVMYTVSKRTKEISIRKVLGASPASVTLLLTKEFLKLILIAALIALPAGYLSGSMYLSNYAYRVNLGVHQMAVSFLIVLVIGIITIASQTIRAARVHPARGLQSE